VTASGRADLALSTGSAQGNCFSANAVGTTRPRDLQTPSCTRVPVRGDAGVAAALTRPVRLMVEETMRRRNPPSYRAIPAPPPQPNMPGG
jgi:hypothetical protein